MKNISVRRITGVAILLAIEVVLQIIAILLPTPVSINLSLIPIAIGAIVYGPIAGAFLGLLNGIITLFDPNTYALFFQYAPVGTLITCLVKCTVAGLVSGLVYKLISKKNRTVGAIIASILIPVINSGLFAAACFTILGPAIDANNEGKTIIEFVFLALIGWNFIFEFGVTSALSPSIVKIMKIMTRSDKHAL